MKRITLIAMLLCGGMAGAQGTVTPTPPSAPGAVVTKAPDTTPKKVPADVSVEILKLQLAQKTTQDEITQLTQLYKDRQALLQQDVAKLEELKAGALKAAGLDAAKWQVDVDALTFVARPEPPKTAETKKP